MYNRNGKKRWSVLDDKALRCMLRERASVGDMVRGLGRTQAAIEKRAEMLLIRWPWTRCSHIGRARR